MAIYKNRTDLHMHTLSSFDGSFTAEQMCQAAVDADLATIAFTDHCDLHKRNFCRQDKRARRYRNGSADI